MKNVAFDQTLALEDQQVFGANEEPGNDALYEEYLRGFDRVPILRDAVVIPPPRIAPPDFRQGERPDVRRETRLDALSLRESNVAELELVYQEYVQAASRRTTSKKRKRKKRKR